jgi:hypothetical protein
MVTESMQGVSFEQWLLREAEPHRRSYDATKPVKFEEVRRRAAAELTSLLVSKKPFSYLRLGDGELKLLLAHQESSDAGFRRIGLQGRVSSSVAYADPGLHPRYNSRLLSSYERCDYLDFYDHYWFNKALVDKLRLDRAPHLHRNASPETSMIFFDWCVYEFKGYVSSRSCMFAGAEAGILAELFGEKEYRSIAAEFWPPETEAYFLDTRTVPGNLDDVKAALRAEILKHGIDTLFLSYGGGAKILCMELAEELNIRAFDFGSLLRALTYSGVSGESHWRAAHNPFLFRVPFALYMSAVERAMPELTPAQVLVRAHAQMCLDLQRKDVGWSYGADIIVPESYDPSPENLKHFRASMDHYRRTYRGLRARGREARLQIREFDDWCVAHHLIRPGILRRITSTFAGAARRIRRLAVRLKRTA